MSPAGPCELLFSWFKSRFPHQFESPGLYTWVFLCPIFSVIVPQVNPGYSGFKISTGLFVLLWVAWN